MDDAIELAPLPRDHGHHEALVANCDEFLLQDAFFAVRAQKALQGFLNGLLLALDISPQPRQRHAGIVGHAAIRQDLPFEVPQESPEIADVQRALPETRETLGHCHEKRFGIRGSVEKREKVEDLLGLEAGAFDPQLLNGRLRVRQSAEIDADGGAPAGGVRANGGPQILHRLARLREVFGEPPDVGMRRYFFQFAPPWRTGDVPPQQLADGFEFENFRTGFQELTLSTCRIGASRDRKGPVAWPAPLPYGRGSRYFLRSRNAFSITASVPSVMRRRGRSRRRTHSTAQASSPAAREPPMARQM